MLPFYECSTVIRMYYCNELYGKNKTEGEQKSWLMSWLSQPKGDKAHTPVSEFAV